MSPRRSTVRVLLTGWSVWPRRMATKPVVDGPSRNFERQSRERGLYLVSRARTVQSDFRVGVDRAAQIDGIGEDFFASAAPINALWHVRA